MPSTRFTYPEIRTFYRPHTQESKLPQEPCPIPLLVFIHGLGGSVAQFHPVLSSLVNLAPTLAIDLPGCGLSSFAPKDWKAYTTESLVRLLAVVIEAHRDRSAGQGVVLIAHSMGCSLAAYLASSTSPYAELISEHVRGFVAICPQATPPDEKHIKAATTMASIPAPIFDLMRRWDRRGGLESKSVLRMVGPNAERETKKLQFRFNEQSRTPVWQRMVYGMLPDSTTGGGLPGKDVWAGLQVGTFLLGGQADTVTPCENVKTIVKFLGRDAAAMEPPSEKASLPIAAAPIDPTVIGPSAEEPVEKRKHQDSGVDASDLPRVITSSSQSLAGQTVIDPDSGSMTDDSGTIADTALTSSPTVSPTNNTPSPHPRRLLVKTTIFPKPAGHSLLFAPSTSRILSGLVGSFLSDHIDPRLSLGWQLQYLTTEGKWEVKNLEKWKAVQPVSLPLARTFRAMKTLREVDEKHSPKTFVKEYGVREKGKEGICAVVDISHDSPVYDPKGLEDGGIKYYKFPTVSKLPPTAEEVRDFIALIERVQSERQPGQEGLIGVHCHYGFNRTGFFLVCYMVEKLGYRVEDAIEEFGNKRPPGIRHAHFIDALHVKYCFGLKRAPTL